MCISILIVVLLGKQHFDLNATDSEGKTALHWSVLYNRKDATEVFPTLYCQDILLAMSDVSNGIAKDRPGRVQVLPIKCFLCPATEKTEPI